MTIIGFNLKKILVERKSLVRGGVKVNTKTKITTVEEDSKIISGKDTISFGFEFFIDYFKMDDAKKELAKLSFDGNIIAVVDPKETKKIVEGWKKEELPMDLRLSILNAIVAKCTVKALALEEEFGLPPHIQLPKFKETKK